MVLYTVANIAQFERRQVSERVAANIKARSERGLYDGGVVILGYKVNPDRAGHLLIDEDAKATVIEAFNAFLKEGTLSSGARYLMKMDFVQESIFRAEALGLVLDILQSIIFI